MLDAVHDECGIVAVADLGAEAEASAGSARVLTMPEHAAVLVPTMLLDMQNRGQLAAGMTTFNAERRSLLRTHRELGSVSEVFRLSDRNAARTLLSDLAGSIAIGHTRYSTCGANDVNYAQPLERPHGKPFKWFSFCFNGNVANHRMLAKRLHDDLGYHLMRPDSDTELFMHFLAFFQRGRTQQRWTPVFRRLAQIVDGSWSMALVTGTGELIVARDPTGLKPLCWGRLGRYVLAASESIALQNVGVREIHDIEPGQLLHVADGQVSIERFASVTKPSPCFFEWIYFANVASVLDGRSVYQARFNLGRALAEMEEETVTRDHIVVPVPDTSKAAGDAFAYTLGIPSIEGLVRNRYIGRTFIESEDRATKVRRKFIALRGILEGKKVFLVDDSIVRSTTLTYLIDYIRDEGGATEVHVRIACPPIMAPCFYGIDMSTISELFAPRMLEKPVLRGQLPLTVRRRMAQAIGADSLQYLPIDKVADCIGKPRDELCMACVSRQYPTRTGRRLYQQARRAHAEGNENGRPASCG